MYQSTIPASILALAALVSGIPTPQDDTPSQTNPWEGVIDPWGVFGITPAEAERQAGGVPGVPVPINSNTDPSGILHDNSTITIAGVTLKTRKISDFIHSKFNNNNNKRDTTRDYVGKIPGCNKEDDPSNKDTPLPPYKVNQGYKIPKDGKHDNCNSRSGTDPNHCWTEYYLVEAALEYFDWQQTGSAIHCSADPHSSCSVSVSDNRQICTTTGSSSTNGWDVKILDFSLKKLPLIGEALSLGGSITKTSSTTKVDYTQVCNQDTTSVTCSWSNTEDVAQDLCHQTWSADRVLHVWGQAQRVCNKCTGDWVQQNTGDGRVCVRGQKEFDFMIPINKILNCNGKCNSTVSPLEKPKNGERGPYAGVNF